MQKGFSEIRLLYSYTMVLSVIRKTIDTESLLQLPQTDEKQSSGGQDVRSPGAGHGRPCTGTIVFHPTRFTATDKVSVFR